MTIRVRKGSATSDWSSDQEEEKNASAFFEFRQVDQGMQVGMRSLFEVRLYASLLSVEVLLNLSNSPLRGFLNPSESGEEPARFPYESFFVSRIELKRRCGSISLSFSCWLF